MPTLRFTNFEDLELSQNLIKGDEDFPALDKKFIDAKYISALFYLASPVYHYQNRPHQVFTPDAGKCKPPLDFRVNLSDSFFIRA
jgi:hypothetical protein